MPNPTNPNTPNPPKSRITERREITLEATELRVEGDDDSRRLVGLAVPYNQWTNLGSFRERFAAGCFADSLTGERNIQALYNHRSGDILASTQNETLTLIDEPGGLRFEMTVAKTTAGNDTLELVGTGEVRGMSFGFRVVEDNETWNRDEGEITRTVVKADLDEITVTGRPAYGQTSVDVRSIDPAALERAKALAAENDPADACPELRLRELRFRERMSEERAD
ncbi:MAG: HK97 family phage prohead protease [Planctomycetota bacterium]